MTVVESTLASERLRQRLEVVVEGELGAVEWLDEIDSTNSALLERAPTLPDRSLLLADRQTAGRGRRGRQWTQSPDGGLALSLLVRVAFPAASLLVRMAVPAASLGGLSLAVGVTIAEALAAAGAEGVELKWPNDLQARGRKLGGLLIELSSRARTHCELVIGLGLNLRLAGDADPDWIDLAALGLELDAERAAVLVAPAMLAAVDTFAQRGFDVFAARWAALDALRGQPVRVIVGSAEIFGQALGVTAGGELRVLCEDGERRFASADVSVRRQ